MRRAVLLALALLLCAAPAARAWTWPAGGPVLRPFAFDPAHPYAGGQHRGIDVGGSIGEAVLAPAGGAVTFAGSVPNSGRVVTITTPDGYAVTLVHLGSIAVVRGAVVAEGAPIGTVGPSPDTPDPSVYLGIRIAAQPQGYVDPLTLLPPRPVAPLPAPVPTPAPEPPAAPVVPAAATPGPDAAPAPAAQPEASPSPTTSVTEPAAPSPGDSVAPAGDSASAPAESPAEPAAPSVAPPVAPAEDAAAPAADPAPVAPEVAPAEPAPEPILPDPPPAPAPTVDYGPDPIVEVEAAEAAAATADQAPTPPTGAGPGAAPETAPVDAAVPGAPEPLDSPPPPPVPVIGDPEPRRGAWLAPAGTAPASIDLVTVPVPIALFFPPAAELGKPAPALPGSLGAHHPSRLRPARAANRPVARRPAGAVARAVSERTAPLTRRHRRRLPFLLLLPFTLAAAGIGVRIMGRHGGRAEQEDLRRGRVAVCERAAAHRTRGGLRRAVGHVRALPPAQGQRRPDGQRHRRARHAGDGRRGRRGRVAA